ncbi:MAG: Uncharacterized protein K0Q66_751 [Chitinophagaceae bacterium]|jgi:hypothetical protein|nr:Uncharacterized protein [Chitinophagaceae bacterium]
MPSSVIKKYEYRPGDKVLAIEFVSGAIYDYLDVPEETYREMKANIQKGVFFNQHIKDKYKCVKVRSASVPGGKTHHGN